MEAGVSPTAKKEKEGRNCGRDSSSSTRWKLPWNGDRKLKVTEERRVKTTNTLLREPTNAKHSFAQNPSETLIAYNKGNIWPVACLCMISKLRMVFYILQCCKEKYAIKTM